MSIDEYILKTKNLAGSLMAAAHYVTDYELILYILGGLGNLVLILISSRVEQKENIVILLNLDLFL